MVCVVLQNLVDREEGGLVVPDHAGVGGYLGLALGEGVEGVYGLVGGDIGRKMDDNLHFLGGHIVNLLDVDLLLVLGFEDAVNDALGGLSVRNLRDGDGGLVHFVDAGTHLDHAAATALVVLGAVCDTAGREVRQEGIGLSLEDGYGSIQELIEVVGKNLGAETGGNAFRSLGQQQWEAHREFRGFLVTAVVGGHPRGYLGVKDHFLGKLGQPGLDVTGRSVGVSGENVTPVSLAVNQKTFLPQGDQGAQDGGVSVRMVLHGLTHDVGHLGVAAVIHGEHGVQHTALYRLESVYDVGDGAVQDGIGGVVQIPVLEHAGELELPAVAGEEFVKLPTGNGVFTQFFFLFLRFNIFPIFGHKKC